MTLSDSVFERLLQQRIVVLGQQVDDEIANRIAAQMLLLSAEDPTADIALYINSPGGSARRGWPSSTRWSSSSATGHLRDGAGRLMGQFLLFRGDGKGTDPTGSRCGAAAGMRRRACWGGRLAVLPMALLTCRGGRSGQPVGRGVPGGG
jgi:hypothetical protein